jgi:predicted SAM-dependent methyltransferase
MSRKLHIGGTVAKDGWEVLNALQGEHVDHQCNASDLSRFSDGTFSEIYASHVLEHFDYRDELLLTLKEWHRVLKPAGRLLVSVPNLDVLAALLLDKERLTLEERFFVMRMIFGGHCDDYDYHLVGLNEEFLVNYLYLAGFSAVYSTDLFNIFSDTSSMVFKDIPISLNLIAEKAE